MENATYAKLRDGSWGLRTAETVKVGDVVLATTKGGAKSRKEIVQVVWVGNGIALCVMGNAPKAKKVKTLPPPANDGAGELNDGLDPEYYTSGEARDGEPLDNGWAF